ncbi:MAG: hypothetical protein WDO13_21460 [Verrucomicrobiota bacterium]
MPGVSIGPEFWWNEAGYCWNVTVAHNTFRGCGTTNSDQGALLVHGDGAIGNRAITVRDNTFDSCYGASVIHADETDGLVISGNHFTGAFQVQGGSPGNIIRLWQVRNADLQGERGHRAGALCRRPGRGIRQRRRDGPPQRPDGHLPRPGGEVGHRLAAGYDGANRFAAGKVRL